MTLLALSYLGFLVFIPLFIGEHTPAWRRHTRRGLLLLGLLIGSVILALYHPRLGAGLFLVVITIDVIAYVETVRRGVY